MAIRDNLHVGALATVNRLLNDLALYAAGLECRFQKVRVTGRHLPQERERRLVRQHHFPWWLDDVGNARKKIFAEFLGDEPFPRIKFEQRRDRTIFQI